ncbi:NUDIX hydrolase [Zobellella taiwanensis]|jgi:phosphatase NudJ|uniref:Phosphatase NudJ n=1 Tax=Zobellella taiwanensis TaxID=347535 RepID=A0A2P7R6U8_9GAMM|nr:NUDIX hydrolase [Zobellella taiwanensis]PSJ45924.1 NUDIX hydrolase [Zobellella taiwanensis]
MSHAVTLAVIVRAGERFLMVEEWQQGRIMFNQPAGHLEPGEDLLAGARRELLEETGLSLPIGQAVGIYQYQAPDNGKHFVRFTFCVEVAEPLATHPQDPDGDIIRCHWLTLAEIEALGNQLRSPLILASFRDYLAGARFPLDVLKSVRREA